MMIGFWFYIGFPSLYRPCFALIICFNSKTQNMQDLRAGNDVMPKAGDTVVIIWLDWDGYTVGYYGEYLKLEIRSRVVLLSCKLAFNVLQLCREMINPFTDSD
ncbi:hypothetical protein L1987_72518 [Smallanthus sonchifolius]|uniref:Uncharacterized protein n=1 Tax=Smallanthus sonchifolius TaxID=185202 RepID=A0ACB9AVF4_9ASTR|nr:hypothetical protein L1987_72518 [Smallanthus sonchifolius]